MDRCFCGEKAVFISEAPLCSTHFVEWLDSSVQRELDKFVEKKDVLAVAVSGGKDSTTLLDIAERWSRGKVRLFAICIDEGISGYRAATIKFLRKFCDKRKIPLHIFSFEKEIGKTLDDMLKNRERPDIKACSICGTFRRYILNKKSRELGATKILFAHNRDDEIQTLLMNLFTGNLPQISTKGEIGGVVQNPLFVVRFKPLLYISEKAMATYAIIKYDIPDAECPNLQESARFRLRHFLNDLELKRPGAKRKMMQLYNQILPNVKKNARKLDRTIKKCKECREPSSREVCRACELKTLLN